MVRQQCDKDWFMDIPDDRFAGALKRLGDDDELFCELAAFFAEDAPALLAAMRTGVAAGNAENVSRAAHSLRGLLVSFDWQQAAAIAGTIEQMGGAGALQTVPAALSSLDAEVQSLTQALRDHAREGSLLKARKIARTTLSPPG